MQISRISQNVSFCGYGLDGKLWWFFTSTLQSIYRCPNWLAVVVSFLLTLFYCRHSAYTEVGFSPQSGFTKKVLTPMFPLSQCWNGHKVRNVCKVWACNLFLQYIRVQTQVINKKCTLDFTPSHMYVKVWLKCIAAK